MIFLEAVEEMLGVIKELLHLGLEIGQRIGNELQVALRGGLQDFFHLKERGLAQQGHHRGPAVDELQHVEVGFRAAVFVMGHAERGEQAGRQVVILDLREKLSVLGVGTGPAAFDVVDAHLGKFLGRCGSCPPGRG